MSILTLIVSIVIFLVVILLLVALLLFVKAKLTPSGEVKVSINNGERELTVEPGGNLLSALGNEKIFLPSACGGGGTCGMCKCQVHSGGGSILPTEVGFFTRKEQQDNWRLGCQVKVREDVEIGIHKEILGIKKWECEVISNKNVATFIKEFVVKLPEGEILDFQAGGYIQIDIPKYDNIAFKDMAIEEEYHEDWNATKMWDLNTKNPEATYRAYSMANHPAEGNIIMLNIRIATPPWDRAKGGFMDVNPGICSSYIFSKKPGDKITISGPYGEFFMRDTENEIIFIGGGAGMAPMRSHIFDLFHTKRSTRKATFYYGARSLREVFYEDDFRALEKEFPNFKFVIALSEPKPEDNWTGATGFIHQVVYDTYLKDHESPEDIEFYLCGPQVMTDAITNMADNLGVPPENVMYDDFGS